MALAPFIGRKSQQPLPRAVARFLLGDHIGPANGKCILQAAGAGSAKYPSSRQSLWHPGDRSSARSAACACAAAFPERRRGPGFRQAPPATGPSAMGADHSANRPAAPAACVCNRVVMARLLLHFDRAHHRPQRPQTRHSGQAPGCKGSTPCHRKTGHWRISARP